MTIHWLLELNVFGDRETRLAEAAVAQGQRSSAWSDSWWEHGRFPCRADETVIFHGSLENAARMARDSRWSPGAFCDVAAFRCSSWHPAAKQWALNKEMVFTTVAALVNDPSNIFPESPRLFIRPDSPLKPFSGRVLERGQLTLASLDHGFYYDDLELPIAVSPATTVSREYRFVIVGKEPVAGSSYEADGRQAISPVLQSGQEWQYAAEISAALPAPEPIYVLDICETRDGLRLLELNPFSGADLYNCSPEAIIQAVAKLTAPQAR